MGYTRTTARLSGWLGLGIVIVLALAMAAQAAVTPKISVRKINDYGRIFFSWPEETRLKASEQGNRITIAFSQATSLDASRIASQLSPYITGAQLSADGKTLNLSTNHPYKIRQFVSGNATGVDILQLKEGGTKEALSPVEPEAEKIDAEPAAKPSPKPVVQTKPTTPNTPTMAKPASKPVAPKQTKEPAAVAEVKPATKPAFAKPVTKPTPPPANTNPSPFAQPEKPAPVIEQATTDTSVAPVEVVQEAQAEPAPEATPAVEEPKPTEEMEKPQVIAEVPTQDAEAEAAQKEAAPESDPFAEFIANAQPQEPAPDDAKRLEGVAEMEDDAGMPFLVTVRQVPRGVDVYFPWRERVAAAAFKRHNDIFLVFNSAANLRLDLLRSLLPASIENVEQLSVAGHTVLRFVTDGSLGIAARQQTNGYEWVLNISAGRRIASNPAEIIPITDGVRPHIFIPVIQDGDTVEVIDPTLGDTLLVRPFYDAGVGIYPTRSYPQFTLLESPQGLVVEAKDDSTQVSGLRNGIRVAAGTHTALSKDLPQLTLAELDMTASGEQTTLFPYDKWKVKPEDYDEARQDLERKISQAADIRASSLMLKLAQLYLGEGLAVEALGIIDALRAKDPFFYDEQKVAALRGAAFFLMSRIPEAAREFDSDSLKEVSEIKLWKDALRIFQEGGRPRFDYLDYDGPYIDKYPPSLRQKLALIAADNYINRKNYSRASRIFTQLNEDGILEPIEDEMNYLLGKIASENGRIESARQLWEPLAQQDHNRFVRARSEYSLVAMLYNNGDIELDEAIDRLDRLRIVWRGDSLELGLLSQLGQLYMDNLEYLRGLRAWDELTTYFPQSAVAVNTASKMSETFDYLFLDDGADEITPLEALAIFQEFRQLIPVGQKGDLMVQKLADRLASVDLLAWAASLLEHQVKFRLEGEARSRVGTRLALLYLLNKQPEKALETLELTNYGANPRALDDHRERLTAWAYSESGQPQRAISMLSDDFTDQSKAIRLSVYWRMGDWLNVIDTAEEILGERANLTAPLTPREAEHLLRLAIAYSFEGNKKQLAYLRDYYGPLIPEDNPNRDTLMFVTDERGPITPTNFGDVTSQISSIETFMQDYRDQIQNAGLSSAFN